MEELMKEIEQFNKERDWNQFHSLENLAKSISIEAGELLECFQWNNNYEKDEVCEELADVFTYCIMMADKLGVDPQEIIFKKLDKTRKKYPVDKAQAVAANTSQAVLTNGDRSKADAALVTAQFNVGCIFLVRVEYLVKRHVAYLDVFNISIVVC